jgi:4'-phosphopantetheinyl transferase EntD
MLDPAVAADVWRHLFLPGVVVVTHEELSGEDGLYAEEHAAIARAVPARRREFADGRRCARAALGRLHCPPVAIPVGRNREPVWPEGYAGSISHCPGFRGAAVGRRGERGLRSLGFDAEPAAPLPEGLAALVCSPTELEYLAGRPDDTQPWDRLFFSAKESTFKCVFPVERRFLGYHDVDVRFGPREGEFRIDMPGSRIAPAALAGRFALLAGFVFTAVTWAEGAPCR